MSANTTSAVATLLNDAFERRVLARQLELMSAPTRGAVIGTPLWAAAVCWILSGPFPAIGVAPLLPSLAWLGAVVGVCGGCLLMQRAYQRALTRASFDPYVWVWRYTGALALLSSVWASLAWVFWIDGNPTNQLSLTILVFCGITNGIIARMNKFETYLVGTGLAIFVLWSKFLTAESGVPTMFAALLPLWFVAMTLNVRVASRHVRKNIATQIENEVLTEGIAKARDEAERQRQLAERASEMKSAFLANMSHELRTPLNAILGFSEVIAEESFGPQARERYQDYAKDIHSSGKHLLSLISDLLDVAKIEAGKLKLEGAWLDGPALIAQSLRLVEERAAGKGIGLRYVDKTEGAQLYADERAFLQIALNLLSNAVKFTSTGEVTATLRAERGAMVFAVEDTGCGIAQDAIARLFNPFEQVDNRYARANGGTGLGLTLVRALAELHGGSCMIESAVGKGTRVEVRLPNPADAALSHAAA
ncbi:MAG: HAMP domain-containing histidine kinase [Alphaproteobacteria bacterium]|nr:HAMP domain-containing histidine kinase [Alphaproteobacteria bacterium]